MTSYSGLFFYFARIYAILTSQSGILQNEIDMFIYTLMEINTQACFFKYKLYYIMKKIFETYEKP